MAYWKKYRSVRKSMRRLMQETDSGSDHEQGVSNMMEIDSSDENNELAGQTQGLNRDKSIEDSAFTSYRSLEMYEDDDCFFDSDAIMLSTSSESDSPDTNSDTNITRNDLAHLLAKNNCSRAFSNELLAILRRAGLDLPKDSRSLLQTPYSINTTQKCGGDYFYIGIEKHIQYVLTNEIEFLTTDIQLKVNVDGLPLHKSSSTQLWPILCSSRDIPPFVVALYCARHKPNSVQEFMSDFLVEAKRLNENGLVCNGVVYTVSIVAFICDAPARSFLKCIKLHTSYFSCERCTVRGEWSGRVVFNSDQLHAARTDADFDKMRYKEHQQALSPLVDHGISCIKSFVLDYMHLACLGVTRRILRFLKGGPKLCRISYIQQCSISERLESFRKYIPSEFARRPRSLLELDRWKATEYRQFMLYTGIVALKGNVSSKCYDHFVCFMLAMTILLSSNVEKRTEYINYSRELLKTFVYRSRVVYGETFTVYNVHNLIHLPDDVEHSNCSLNEISSFPFENYLHQLKKTVKSGKSPVVQAAKRIAERRNFLVESQRKRADTNSFKIAVNGRDDCFILNNGRVVFIRADCMNGTYSCDVVKKRHLQCFFTEPCSSDLFDIYFVKSQWIGRRSASVTKEQLSVKAIKLPFKDGFVIMPVVTQHEL